MCPYRWGAAGGCTVCHAVQRDGIEHHWIQNTHHLTHTIAVPHPIIPSVHLPVARLPHPESITNPRIVPRDRSRATLHQDRTNLTHTPHRPDNISHRARQCSRCPSAAT